MAIDTKRLRNGFLFGSHYAMERFGVLLAFLLIGYISLFVWGAHTKADEHRAALSDRTLYSGATTTSRSGVTVVPVGVFSDAEQANVVLLMRITDLSKVGIDAKDYDFMLGAQREDGSAEDMLSHPSAAIYFYEGSGYMAVTLQNGVRFPRQILYGIFHNGRDLSGRPAGGSSLAEVYDVWTVTFNPGADGVYPTEAFRADGAFDADYFYSEVVIRNRESQVRSTLVRDVERMESELTVISEYERRVREDGVDVDSMVPDWVSGDAVVTQDDGSKALVTDVIAEGGYDFDWYHGSVSDGYLSSVMAGLGVDASVTPPATVISGRSSSARPFASVSGTMLSTWHMTDGTTVADAQAADMTNHMDAVVRDIGLLTDSWNAYGATKYKYQTSDLSSLLSLEVELTAAKGSYTANLENVVSYRG